MTPSPGAPILLDAPAVADFGTIDRRFVARAAAFNLVVTVAMFATLLLAGPGTVVSQPGNDVTAYWAHVRAFGFGDLLQTGRPPFWNPHVFSGTPYFANPQSAALYPPNLLHAILPVAVAINLVVAVHFFLTGLFTSLLARGRGLAAPAAAFAGCAFPLTGGYFMHVYAGHLGIVSFCWAPLLLLAIDGLLRGPSLRWPVIATAAVTMTLLAGHPQMAYYTALVAATYLLVQLPRCDRKRRAVFGFVAAYALGAGIAAVQLLPILAASRDYVRSGGLTYAFASSGSLPPETLLTLVVPRLFGTWDGSAYTARSFPWETGIYCGTALFLLACFGAVRGGRNRWPLVVLLGVTLVLALGAFLPTYRVLYRVIPLLDHFRYPARFGLFADLFLVLLAGYGVDRLVADRRAARGAAITFAAAALVLVTGGLWLARDVASAPNSAWASLMRAVGNSGEVFVPKPTFSEPEALRVTGAYAARQVGQAALAAGLLAVASALALRRSTGAYVAAAVALAEVFFVAYGFRISGPIAADYPPAWQAAQDRLRPGERVLTADMALANRAMTRGADDGYGYDPLVLRRYAEFLAVTQGASPDAIDFVPPVLQPHRLFALLRCRYALGRPHDPHPLVIEFDDPLPEALLVSRALVPPRRDALLATLADPAFDPRRTVLLETPPDPAPAPSDTSGTVSVVRRSPDALEIRATVHSPSVLLITDAYAPGWSVRPLESTGPQRKYDLLPANYVLRGIPLAAGDHHLLVRYVPPGLVTGAVLSAISAGVAAGGLAYLHRRRLRVSAGAR